MNFDVVVLGGGAIGANCAYELSKAGLKVALLEKRHFSSGASGASAAMLEFQIDAHRGEPFYSFSKASNDLFADLYEDVKNLTGVDFQFERCGILHLASSEDNATAIQAEVQRQLKLGLKVSWIDLDSLQDQFPYLNPTHFGAALYHEDGQVNGETFVSTLIKGAQKNGATCLGELGEVQFSVSNHRVTGVQTKNETYTAQKYIVAAGSWSDEILAPLDVKLGMIPIRGQLVIYDTPNNFLKHPIYTERSGYLTPKRNGYTLAGTTVERVGFDETTTEKAKIDISKMACDLIPNFSKKTIRGISAGLRPGSPDGLPFIGPLQGHDNILIATGHYRNGILLSPITARIITALVLGQNPPVEILPFLPTDFCQNKVRIHFMSEELRIFHLVANRLENNGISYMLTGSFAAGFYANPRMTRDLDLVVEIRKPDTSRFFELFKDDFYVDLVSIQEAVDRCQMFNMIHFQTNIKVDFIIRKNEPYRVQEFERRRQIDFGGVKAWCVSPEDLILSKLWWAKDSFSEMQLRDVKTLIDNVPNLDQVYLKEWIGKLDLKEIYSKLPNE